MKSFERLIKALRRLPGVGPRQAERFCTYFLRAPQSQTEEFIAALREMKQNVRMCSRCFTYCEDELCTICSDDSRNPAILCVVEETQDIEAIEKTKIFGGYYHVLHGALSPMDARGVDSLRIRELEERVKASPALKEIIIATDPDTEGEATALYLSRLLNPLGLSISRIAYGVPLGGDLDYTDEMTLGYAIKGRTKI